MFHRDRRARSGASNRQQELRRIGIEKLGRLEQQLLAGEPQRGFEA